MNSYAEKGMRAAFRQFARNFRWGTCVACPQDNEGAKYPEFCRYTDRYDHQLDLDALVFRYRVFTKGDGSDDD